MGALNSDFYIIYMDIMMNEQELIESSMYSQEPSFNEFITGVFGSFHTESSFDVNYLLTSLNYKQLDLLMVAAEAFDFNQVNFDEMIQREIDYRRVNEEIVGDYLEKGADKALFFPPLIVSLVAFDENDKPIHKYSRAQEIEHTDKDVKYLKKIWDRYFQIELPLFKSSIDMYKSETQGEVGYFKNNVKLSFDRNFVKLVVIDGQHRLKAIQEYIKKNPNGKKFLNLPVCICFSPKAIEDNGSEDILDTLRNMFVTINNKGKQVSGHYIDLLNDKSLASQTVRALANRWKSSSSNPISSYLQFIEWNQRVNSKSRRVNRPQSITTVSMLCDSLKSSIYLSDKDSAYLFNILELNNNREQLETDEISIYDISESSFSYSQQNALYDLINSRIVEPLEILLITPSVYERRINSFNKAMTDLEAKVAGNHPGARSFMEIISKFSDVDIKLHPEEAKIVSDAFYKSIKSNEFLENYTRLVFNQAYLRVWAAIVDAIPEVRGCLIDFTKCFVKSLEVLAFDESRNIFSKEREFNQLMLYKANKPNTTKAGKNCWYNLLMLTFINLNSKKIIRDFVIDKGGDFHKIESLINKSKLSLVGALKENIEKDASSSWRFKEYPLSFKNELEELDRLGTMESKSKMIKLLEAKALVTFEERLDILSNALGVDRNILLVD